MERHSTEFIAYLAFINEELVKNAHMNVNDTEMKIVEASWNSNINYMDCYNVILNYRQQSD